MVLQNFNLAGKTAIVTGCNTGLGQGMALARDVSTMQSNGNNWGCSQNTTSTHTPLQT